MSKPSIIGWDIGGAHLKAVLLDDSGEVLQVLQQACPLWKGLNQLELAINNALNAFKIAPSEPALECNSPVATNNLNHAVTMTGELVDLFANRHEGVMEISKLAAKLLGKDTLFYAANAGFVALERVSALTPHIASTNWHASASALAMQVNDALLIDIGSTTTDIIAIEAGKVKAVNLTDAARMAADSLVYTGVVRTPVMALAQKLPFEGQLVNVAAEYFSTMADVYRLTGELLPNHDMAETADGKGKTTLESSRRLARMIGHDVESRDIETWINLAQTCKTLQMNQIKAAIAKHLKRNMTIIGAGAGSFLVEQIASELNCAYQPASMSLTGNTKLINAHDLEVCFPAFAVATLTQQHA